MHSEEINDNVSSQSKTDKENSDPNRGRPRIDSEEPNRDVLRNAMEAPIWEKTSTDKEEPKRAMLLKTTYQGGCSPTQTIEEPKHAVLVKATYQGG